MERLKELIEKQIETAGNYLRTMDGYMDATGGLDADALRGLCICLFEIVRNQQQQIEQLEKRVSDIEPQTAMRMLGAIVEREGGKNK